MASDHITSDSAAGGIEGAVAASAEPTKAARAPRKRTAAKTTATKSTTAKRTRARGAQTDGEGASSGDAPEATTTLTAEAEASSAIAPKATRRRSAKAPAAAVAPADTTEPGDSTEHGQSTEPPAEPAAEAGTPPVKATRKRATKSAAKSTRASARKAVAEGVSEAVPEQGAAADGRPAESIEGAETLEGSAAESPADRPAEPVSAASAGFGLIFQAPDPTVRRSRRATAPVQTPVAAPAPAFGVGTADVDGDEDEAELDAAARGAAAGLEAAGPEAGEAHAAESDEPTESEAAEAELSDGDSTAAGRRRRRGGRGRRARTPGGADSSERSAADPHALASTDDAAGEDIAESDNSDNGDAAEAADSASSRRRRRRRRGAGGAGESDDPPGTVTRVREPRTPRDEPTAVRGSTRLEAKKQRRREGREAGRRRTIITEAEFLARRESVDRIMVVRGKHDRTQIGVLEDGVLVEHYVSRDTSSTMVGNVYLGRVQNVLPSMEAAFVDIGKGRNAVLYAGEVNWDAAGLEVNQAKRIENALTSGDTVLVQVTKDPIGHKGARLTSQISLPGRFLVYVPEGSMTGISRKLPDTERARLKAILKEIVPDSAGVIVRTAAEGASEEELRADVDRLTSAWAKIQKKVETASAKKAGSGGAPMVVHGEPDLTVRVIRDIFTEDFAKLIVSGDRAWDEVSAYVEDVAPDLAARVSRWTSEVDVFTEHRIQEQIAKAMDRKVWLPSGGSLVIDRTEAMTVVDVNTGKFVGSGGNLEETVTKNNIEAAEEIVRQLRLRDIGGIIVIDFIDMVLESNRDLVVRRLLECLGRDRTKHQVAEVTSLGLVQMTRKRVGSGLIEVFSESCEHCSGRGIVVHSEPIERSTSSASSGGHSGHGGQGSGNTGGQGSHQSQGSSGNSRSRGRRGTPEVAAPEPERKPAGPTLAQIAAAAHAAAVKHAELEAQDAPVEVVREFDGDDSEVPQAESTAPSHAPMPEAHAELLSSDETHDVSVASSPETNDAEPVTHADASTAASADASAAVSAAAEQAAADTAYLAQMMPTAAAEAKPRRRRGRVVAPAGPPKVAEESANLEADPSGQ